MTSKNLFIFVTDPVKTGKDKDSRSSCYLANGIVKKFTACFGCFSKLMLVWLNSL